MALETATYIDSLVVSNPDGADQRSTADDHLRLIKAVLKRSFPMVGGAVSASATAISRVNDLSASAQAQLNTLRDGSATAHYAVLATRALSASAAGFLGTISAGAVARIDAGVGGNVFSSTPTVSNIQTFTGLTAYHRMFAKNAPTGQQGWLVNYATWDAVSRGRLLTGLAGDSGTWVSTVTSIIRSLSYVELFDIYLGAGGQFRVNVTGTGWYDVLDPIQMNGVAAASYARLDQAQTFSGGQGSTPVAVGYSSTITPNCSSGDVHRVVLTGNVTFAAPSSPRPGQTLVLIVRQGGSGGYTATWNSIYKFAGGADPVLSTAVGACDVFGFIYDNLSAEWLQAGLNVS